MHAPGPAAIPIVDPATLATISQVPPQQHSGCSTTSQSAPSTPHSLQSHAPQRNLPLFSTPPITNATGGNGAYSSNSTPHYYTVAACNIIEQQSGGANAPGNSSSPHNSYTPSSSHEKRNNASGGGKKPPSYVSGSTSRQNSNSSYNGASKPPLLSSTNDTRASPNSSSSNHNGYHQSNRTHSLSKRGGGEKTQVPLLSGPPSYSTTTSTTGLATNNNSYHAQHNAAGVPSTESKPPMRLNAAAASFRQKPNSGIEFRRSVSQRNSPSTNSNSNENSNNTSPNSIVGSNAATPIAATSCYPATYINSTGGAIAEHQTPTATATTPLYITARGSHIPPQQLQHGANAVIAGSQPGTTAAILGGTAVAAAAAEVANAAAAAAAAASVAHHQPLLGTYNPAASGVYFKYGQTYFAHPSVALPNSRRSPSTELRPQMAQMTGMYPTVNMMIPAPPRHAQGRHPNPNYKGTRPR